MLDVILAEHGRPFRKVKNLRKDTLGLSGTRFFKIWKGMKARCYTHNSVSYRNYGAKGIRICDRWHQFNLFYEDMSPNYFAGATIDRIDNSKDYCPENCRWATAKEQQRNKKNNRVYTYNNQTKCLTEWAEYFGCGRVTLDFRIKSYGMPMAFDVTASLPKNKRADVYKPKGESHMSCKTKDIQVKEVIDLLLKGKNCAVISRHMGLKYSHVYSIKVGHIRNSVCPEIPRPIQPRSCQSTRQLELSVRPDPQANS